MPRTCEWREKQQVGKWAELRGQSRNHTHREPEVEADDEEMHRQHRASASAPIEQVSVEGVVVAEEVRQGAAERAALVRQLRHRRQRAAVRLTRVGQCGGGGGVDDHTRDGDDTPLLVVAVVAEAGHRGRDGVAPHPPDGELVGQIVEKEGDAAAVDRDAEAGAHSLARRMRPLRRSVFGEALGCRVAGRMEVGRAERPPAHARVAPAVGGEEAPARVFGQVAVGQRRRPPRPEADALERAHTAEHLLLGEQVARVVVARYRRRARAVTGVDARERHPRRVGAREQVGAGLDRLAEVGRVARSALLDVGELVRRISLVLCGDGQDRDGHRRGVWIPSKRIAAS